MTELEKILSGERPLSFTSLKEFAESPKHFIRYIEGEKVQTDAMLFGQAMHHFCLQEDTFNDHYTLLDKVIDRRTKDGKEVYQYYLDKGLPIIKKDDFELIVGIRTAIQENANARIMLYSESVSETAFEFEYEGLKFRGFRDNISYYGVCDLKKCTDANPKVFQWEFKKRNLKLQAAIYTHEALGVAECPYFIVAVDQNANVSLIEVSPSTLRDGREELDHLIRNFKRCAMDNLWHEGYEFWQPKGFFTI
jgi:PDDEXK-like domain of unknown function (DUF3799)